MRILPFKDADYVPREWNFDNTKAAVTLSRKQIKDLRDELNKEYLRRWSGYIKGVSDKAGYMDYTSASQKYTRNDSGSDTHGGDSGFLSNSQHNHGKHLDRLPSWNGSLPSVTDNTYESTNYHMADGNVAASYWDSNTDRDFRGCPAWYGPMDRYIDGTITYTKSTNTAPTVASGYLGPDQGQTFRVGTSRWQNANSYNPHNINDGPTTSDSNKDRIFKHLIDGLCNIVDIDKYYGTGIQTGDPVVPSNPVNYIQGQDPQNSERINHSYRQMGIVGDSRSGTIKDWLEILKVERRNDYYVRACNYYHWIWYYDHFTYMSNWEASLGIHVNGDEAEPASFEEPNASVSGSDTYRNTDQKKAHTRKNYNPAYYGHRESYTSCLQACTGFCSQTCYHVCDEQCVYMCDDKCGYSCMGGTNCGSVCIASCRDFCGGRMQEGNNGGQT